MIDLHTHVLYGVDDGADDIEETVDMMDLYVQAGYTDIIITPHHDPHRYQVTAQAVRDGVNLLAQIAKEKAFKLNFYPGHEIQLQSQTLQMLQAGEVLTLNDSRYLLIELPFQTKPYYAKELLYRLQLSGYVPIIAHPERYFYAQANPQAFLDLIGPGCLMQLNLTSLIGSGKTLETSLEFIDLGWIQLVSTDAHKATGRSPNQSQALDKLKEYVGAEVFEKLTQTNPKKILEDQHISIDHRPIDLSQAKPQARERGGFFQWIKSLKKY